MGGRGGWEWEGFCLYLYVSNGKKVEGNSTHTQANNFVREAGDEEREKGKSKDNETTVHTQQAMVLIDRMYKLLEYGYSSSFFFFLCSLFPPRYECMYVGYMYIYVKLFFLFIARPLKHTLFLIKATLVEAAAAAAAAAAVPA